jgi:hypothetical protein
MPACPFPWPLLVGLAALAVGALGCAPEVGDPCTTSLDCSQLGDRLCDTSQPEGYCTIFNCEPDQCPEEALCVGFGLDIDPACSSVEDPRWARFERTFCMLGCEEQDDCRAGYVCAPPSERRATSLDIDSELAGSKACFPVGTVPESGGAAPAACSPDVQ